MAEKPPLPVTRRLGLAPLSEEPTNPRIRRSNQLTRLLSLGVAGGFSILTLASVAFAYEKLRDVAKDAGVDGAKMVVGDIEETKRKVQVVDADLQQHKAAEAQVQRELKEDVHAMRGELRELYRSQRTGDRSPVLERPLPPLDGGHR
jgi:hypothetical protein